MPKNTPESKMSCNPHFLYYLSIYIYTYIYIYATSFHRSIYKRSIPYGQAVRIKRICSDEEGPSSITCNF